jgi:hypothetical protein
VSTLILAHVIRVARHWVRLYTAGLPPEIREARRAELESDLWEQEYETAAAHGRPTKTAMQVFHRLVRGIPADLCWRQQQGGARLLRKAGRGAVEGTRRTTAAFARHWVVGLVVLALAGAFSTVGVVSQADGGVERSGPTCFLHPTRDEKATKPAATDR